MKLIREHINEKFEEDSDPISDMDIGMKAIIKKWLKTTYPFDTYYYKNCHINNDLTIDIDDDLDISYNELTTIPEYIKFNKIDGHFACNFDKKTIVNSGPKIVNGDYHQYCNYDDIPTAEFIENNCNVKGEIGIWKYGKRIYLKKYTSRSNIYEKFTEDGDPIKDMNIGKIREIKDFFNQHNYGNHLPYSDWTALNMCIENNKYDFIQYFLDSPGISMEDKVAGLRYAIFSNKTKIVKMFLNAGIKIKDAINKKDVVDLRRFYNINNSIRNIIDKNLTENVNEKFEEESDPIHDLNIGIYRWITLSYGDIIYSEYDDQMTIIKSTKFNEDTNSIDILGVRFYYITTDKYHIEEGIKNPLLYIKDSSYSLSEFVYGIDHLNKYYKIIKYKEQQ